MGLLMNGSGKRSGKYNAMMAYLAKSITAGDRCGYIAMEEDSVVKVIEYLDTVFHVQAEFYKDDKAGNIYHLKKKDTTPA